MGQRMHGEVIAVHVEDGPLGERERKVLADDFKLAERLGIEMPIAAGVDALLHRGEAVDAVIDLLLRRPYRAE